MKTYTIWCVRLFRLGSLPGSLALLALAAAACSSGQGRRADVESEKASLLRVDAEFSKLSEAKGMAESFAAYAVEEATLLPEGGTPISGKESIRGHLSGAPAGSVLTWKPVRADVSASGDFGYTWGTYEFRRSGPDGKPQVGLGKYVTIWKKQADGEWRFVMDIGNHSPPPTPPPAPSAAGKAPGD